MLKDFLLALIKPLLFIAGALFFAWKEKKAVEDDLEDVQTSVKVRDSVRDAARTSKRDKRLQKFDID